MSTNKERLDALGAKLKETQETLNNKILAIEDSTFSNRIIVPDEFSSASSIYAVRINDEKILVSAPITASNVYVLNTKTNKYTMLFNNENGYYCYFQQVTDTEWLIAGTHTVTGKYNVNLMLYNSETDECISVYNNYSQWANYQKVSDTKWLIGNKASGGPPLIMYNTETKTVKVISSSAGAWSSFKPAGGTKWFVGTSTNDYGLRIYDSSDDSFTSIISKGKNWNNLFQITDNKWLISSTAINDSNSVGLYLYKLDDLTCTKIYSTKSGWGGFEKTNSGCLIGCTNTSQGGLLYYNENTDEIIPLLESGWGVNTFVTIDNLTLITSTNVTNFGIKLYNDDLKTLEQVIDSGNGWKFIEMPNNRVLILSGSSSYKGAYIYNMLNSNLNQINSTGYSWLTSGEYYLFEDKIVFFSTSSDIGLSVIDFNAETCTKLYSGSASQGGYTTRINEDIIAWGGGYVRAAVIYIISSNTVKTAGAGYYGWKVLKYTKNKVIFGGGSTGVYVYNINEELFSHPITSGTFTRYRDKGSDILIYNDDVADEDEMYKYDIDTDIAVLYSVYKEV